MLKFLKVLADNIVKGPVTEDFPLKPATTPDRFRGRVTLDEEKCVGCEICRHVCTGNAIRIDDNPGKDGYHFTVWHNTCCLCGHCQHYCPTGAITLTNDWHGSHEQSHKYDHAEHHDIKYLHCSKCGERIRMLPPELATRLYSHSEINMKELLSLCPECRKLATAERKGLYHAAPAESK